MRAKSLLSFMFAMLATIVFAVGCQEPTTDTATSDAHAGHDHGDGECCDHDHGDDSHAGHDHAGHDHAGHDHDGHDHGAHGDPDHPPHGPNHGHIFKFDSDEFTGEWCQYKDNNVIRFYLLDAKGESPKPMVVEQFLVKPMAGSEDEPFELEPEDVDPEGATNSFSSDDLLLRTAIPLGVEIEVITDGKTLKGQIEAHEVMDH